jgi:thioesterase domain-containing protein
MGKQMEARGKEVKLLVMFDTVVGEVVKPGNPSIKNLYNVPL